MFPDHQFFQVDFPPVSHHYCPQHAPYGAAPVHHQPHRPISYYFFSCLGYSSWWFVSILIIPRCLYCCWTRLELGALPRTWHRIHLEDMSTRPYYPFFTCIWASRTLILGWNPSFSGCLTRWDFLTRHVNTGRPQFLFHHLSALSSSKHHLICARSIARFISHI